MESDPSHADPRSLSTSIAAPIIAEVRSFVSVGAFREEIETQRRRGHRDGGVEDSL